MRGASPPLLANGGHEGAAAGLLIVPLCGRTATRCRPRVSVAARVAGAHCVCVLACPLSPSTGCSACRCARWRAVERLPSKAVGGEHGASRQANDAGTISSIAACSVSGARASD